MSRSRREPVIREERVEPTPETVAKLVPDPVHVLFDKGILTSDQTDAVAEIRAIYFAIVGSLFTRAKDYRRMGYSKPELPGWVNDLYGNYRDWCAQMGPFRLPIIMDTIIDGKPAVVEILLDGLDAYIRGCKPARHTIIRKKDLTIRGRSCTA
jgi:hypothetical protein